MKKVILAVVLSIAAGQASAATAFLQHCEGTSSVTGRFIYVGTYQYGGKYFQETFTSYCPATVEIY